MTERDARAFKNYGGPLLLRDFATHAHLEFQQPVWQGALVAPAQEGYDQISRTAVARALVECETTAVEAEGQAILDSVLEGGGVPKFELTGWSNHNAYIWLQIEHASRNESADLHWFWSAVEYLCSREQ